MYEGIETASLTKLDTRFEFDWYLRTVDFIAEEKALETQNALYQLFLGAMRVVLDYKWLPECKGYNLDGISIIASIEEDENGHRENKNNEALGKWEMRIHCKSGKTNVANLLNIEKDMERFIRARFGVKIPEDLTAIKQEYERKQTLTLFTGMEGIANV